MINLIICYQRIIGGNCTPLRLSSSRIRIFIIRLYLVALENLIKNGLTKLKAKSKPAAGGVEGDDEEDDDGNAEEEEKRSRERNSAFLAVKCMTELLVTHPHFNYR